MLKVINLGWGCWYVARKRLGIRVFASYTGNIFKGKWKPSYSRIRAEVPLQTEYNFSLLDIVYRFPSG